MCPSSDCVKSFYDILCDITYSSLCHCHICGITTIKFAARWQMQVLLASYCCVKSHPITLSRSISVQPAGFQLYNKGCYLLCLICDRTLSPYYVSIFCVAHPCWKGPPIAIRPAVNLCTWIAPFVASWPD